MLKPGKPEAKTESRALPMRETTIPSRNDEAVATNRNRRPRNERHMRTAWSAREKTERN